MEGFIAGLLLAAGASALAHSWWKRDAIGVGIAFGGTFVCCLWIIDLVGRLQ